MTILILADFGIFDGLSVGGTTDVVAVVVAGEYSEGVVLAIWVGKFELIELVIPETNTDNVSDVVWMRGIVDKLEISTAREVDEDMGNELPSTVDIAVVTDDASMVVATNVDRGNATVLVEAYADEFEISIGRDVDEDMGNELPSTVDIAVVTDDASMVVATNVDRGNATVLVEAYADEFEISIAREVDEDVGNELPSTVDIAVVTDDASMVVATNVDRGNATVLVEAYVDEFEISIGRDVDEDMGNELLSTVNIDVVTDDASMVVATNVDRGSATVLVEAYADEFEISIGRDVDEDIGNELPSTVDIAVVTDDASMVVATNVDRGSATVLVEAYVDEFEISIGRDVDEDVGNKLPSTVDIAVVTDDASMVVATNVDRGSATVLVEAYVDEFEISIARDVDEDVGNELPSTVDIDVDTNEASVVVATNVDRGSATVLVEAYADEFEISIGGDVDEDIGNELPSTVDIAVVTDEASMVVATNVDRGSATVLVEAYADEFEISIAREVDEDVGNELPSTVDIAVVTDDASMVVATNADRGKFTVLLEAYVDEFEISIGRDVDEDIGNELPSTVDIAVVTDEASIVVATNVDRGSATVLVEAYADEFEISIAREVDEDVGNELPSTVDIAVVTDDASMVVATNVDRGSATVLVEAYADKFEISIGRDVDEDIGNELPSTVDIAVVTDDASMAVATNVDRGKFTVLVEAYADEFEISIAREVDEDVGNELPSTVDIAVVTDDASMVVATNVDRGNATVLVEAYVDEFEISIGRDVDEDMGNELPSTVDIAVVTDDASMVVATNVDRGNATVLVEAYADEFEISIAREVDEDVGNELLSTVNIDVVTDDASMVVATNVDRGSATVLVEAYADEFEISIAREVDEDVGNELPSTVDIAVVTDDASMVVATNVDRGSATVLVEAYADKFEISIGRDVDEDIGNELPSTVDIAVVTDDASMVVATNVDRGKFTVLVEAYADEFEISIGRDVDEDIGNELPSTVDIAVVTDEASMVVATNVDRGSATVLVEAYADEFEISIAREVDEDVGNELPSTVDIAVVTDDASMVVATNADRGKFTVLLEAYVDEFEISIGRDVDEDIGNELPSTVDIAVVTDEASMVVATNVDRGSATVLVEAYADEFEISIAREVDEDVGNELPSTVDIAVVTDDASMVVATDVDGGSATVLVEAYADEFEISIAREVDEDVGNELPPTVDIAVVTNEASMVVATNVDRDSATVLVEAYVDEFEISNGRDVDEDVGNKLPSTVDIDVDTNEASMVVATNVDRGSATVLVEAYVDEFEISIAREVDEDMGNELPSTVDIAVVTDDASMVVATNVDRGSVTVLVEAYVDEFEISNGRDVDEDVGNELPSTVDIDVDTNEASMVVATNVDRGSATVLVEAYVDEFEISIAREVDEDMGNELPSTVDIAVVTDDASMVVATNVDRGSVTVLVEEYVDEFEISNGRDVDEDVGNELPSTVDIDVDTNEASMVVATNVDRGSATVLVEAYVDEFEISIAREVDEDMGNELPSTVDIAVVTDNASRVVATNVDRGSVTVLVEAYVDEFEISIAREVDEDMGNELLSTVDIAVVTDDASRVVATNVDRGNATVLVEAYVDEFEISIAREVDEDMGNELPSTVDIDVVSNEPSMVVATNVDRGSVTVLVEAYVDEFEISIAREVDEDMGNELPSTVDIDVVTNEPSMVVATNVDRGSVTVLVEAYVDEFEISIAREVDEDMGNELPSTVDIAVVTDDASMVVATNVDRGNATVLVEEYVDEFEISNGRDVDEDVGNELPSTVDIDVDTNEASMVVATNVDRGSATVLVEAYVDEFEISIAREVDEDMGNELPSTVDIAVVTDNASRVVATNVDRGSVTVLVEAYVDEFEISIAREVDEDMGNELPSTVDIDVVTNEPSMVVATNVDRGSVTVLVEAYVDEFEISIAREVDEDMGNELPSTVDIAVVTDDASMVVATNVDRGNATVLVEAYVDEFEISIAREVDEYVGNELPSTVDIAVVTDDASRVVATNVDRGSATVLVEAYVDEFEISIAREVDEYVGNELPSTVDIAVVTDDASRVVATNVDRGSATVLVEAYVDEFEISIAREVDEDVGNELPSTVDIAVVTDDASMVVATNVDRGSATVLVEAYVDEFEISIAREVDEDMGNELPSTVDIAVVTDDASMVVATNVDRGSATVLVEAYVDEFEISIAREVDEDMGNELPSTVDIAVVTDDASMVVATSVDRGSATVVVKANLDEFETCDGEDENVAFELSLSLNVHVVVNNEFKVSVVDAGDNKFVFVVENTVDEFETCHEEDENVAIELSLLLDVHVVVNNEFKVSVVDAGDNKFVFVVENTVDEFEAFHGEDDDQDVAIELSLSLNVHVVVNNEFNLFAVDADDSRFVFVVENTVDEFETCHGEDDDQDVAIELSLLLNVHVVVNNEFNLFVVDADDSRFVFVVENTVDEFETFHGEDDDQDVAIELSLSLNVDVVVNNEFNLFVVDADDSRFVFVVENTVDEFETFHGEDDDQDLAIELSLSLNVHVVVNNEFNLFAVDADDSRFVFVVENTVDEFETFHGEDDDQDVAIELSLSLNVHVVVNNEFNLFAVDADDSRFVFVVENTVDEFETCHEEDENVAIELCLLLDVHVVVSNEFNLFVVDADDSRFVFVVENTVDEFETCHEEDENVAIELSLLLDVHVVVNNEFNLFVVDADDSRFVFVVENTVDKFETFHEEDENVAIELSLLLDVPVVVSNEFNLFVVDADDSRFVFVVENTVDEFETCHEEDENVAIELCLLLNVHVVVNNEVNLFVVDADDSRFVFVVENTVDEFETFHGEDDDQDVAIELSLSLNVHVVVNNEVNLFVVDADDSRFVFVVENTVDEFETFHGEDDDQDVAIELSLSFNVHVVVNNEFNLFAVDADDSRFVFVVENTVDEFETFHGEDDDQDVAIELSLSLNVHVVVNNEFKVSVVDAVDNKFVFVVENTVDEFETFHGEDDDQDEAIELSLLLDVHVVVNNEFNLFAVDADDSRFVFVVENTVDEFETCHEEDEIVAIELCLLLDVHVVVSNEFNLFVVDADDSRFVFVVENTVDEFETCHEEDENVAIELCLLLDVHVVVSNEFNLFVVDADDSRFVFVVENTVDEFETCHEEDENVAIELSLLLDVHVVVNNEFNLFVVDADDSRFVFVVENTVDKFETFHEEDENVAIELSLLLDVPVVVSNEFNLFVVDADDSRFVFVVENTVDEFETCHEEDENVAIELSLLLDVPVVVSNELKIFVVDTDDNKFEFVVENTVDEFETCQVVNAGEMLEETLFGSPQSIARLLIQKSLTNDNFFHVIAILSSMHRLYEASTGC
eukprot:gene9164-16831_t